MKSNFFLSLAGKIRDDRGRAIRAMPVVRGWTGRLRCPEYSLDPAIRSDFRWHQSVWWSWIPRFIGLLVFAYGAQMLIFFPVVTYRQNGLSNLLGLLAFGLVFVFCGWQLLAFHYVAPRRVRIVLMQHGRCPSCGYDLASCQPDPDTCTTCPECGSAWKLHVGDPKPV